MGRPSSFEKHNKVFVFFLFAFELTSFCHPLVRESHVGHFVLCVCLESVPTYKYAIVCVLRSLSAGKSSSLRCLAEGEPFQPLVFCPDENLLPNSLTHGRK